MAENVTLARPYAEAVFALARDAGTLGPWADALQRLAAVAADPAARACLSNPRLTPAQLAQLFAESSGVSLSPEQHNFVSLLVENERAALLPEINTLFKLQKNVHEGVRDAQVTSAFPLDADAQARLAGDLETRFGTRLNVSVALDPELIGGVRIAVGDAVIDASVRGKLATMAAALQN
ncbi:F0F1 ATP synthase subunit delta [Uliginosibacterium sp. H3]|uniref:ATP synthase subunit delta n=1 Tax=Uliginosibacterium silvisoli TaxID=3114758 RepID=A0ABU6JZA1_9RHOO|nr:F0F1 ATP synthase subunit delta [Uliginosibacterium sp. H3]